MDRTHYHACSVCGEISATPEHWFLAFQGAAIDKLTIIKWNNRLASAAGMQPACCVAHVRELVVHWMATGSIDHPFARPDSWDGPCRRWNDHRSPWHDIDLRDAVLLSELTADHEGLRRVLNHNPDALRSLLDSLQGTLHAELRNDVAAAECRSALVI